MELPKCRKGEGPRAQDCRNGARMLCTVKGQKDVMHGGRKSPPPSDEVNVQKNKPGMGKMVLKHAWMDGKAEKEKNGTPLNLHWPESPVFGTIQAGKQTMARL